MDDTTLRFRLKRIRSSTAVRGQEMAVDAIVRAAPDDVFDPFVLGETPAADVATAQIAVLVGFAKDN